MLQDLVRGSIQGFVKIIDKDTREVLVDTHNDVLYGNISSAIAHALIGNAAGFLQYMAFGNGGAYVGPTGLISYKPSQGGPDSMIKLPNANLYNTIYVKKLSNDATDGADYNALARAYIPVENPAVNYTDIVIDVVIEYTEPPSAITNPGDITQMTIDNSTFIGNVSTVDNTTFNPDNLVFNEIGLFCGTENLFPGSFTTTVDEVNSFVNQGANFSNTANSLSKLMITHVIFHPVQKAANRSLEIIYTLRIQMGVTG